MAGSVPAGRAAHSACLIEPGGSIVVFGGTNGQRPFDELWLLHVGSSRWEQLRLPSSLHKPTARRLGLGLGLGLGLRLGLGLGLGLGLPD